MKHKWTPLLGTTGRQSSDFSECQYCHAIQRGGGSDDECPEAERVIELIRKRREAAERREYRRLLDERKRWEYLHNKYGGDE
jgi:hypothetical protein